ncbi:MAG: hypothetical protein NXI09_07030 [Bacteroidetes bacterium]|mgnify:CR=1 FL=1|nr:hypothetical protein [Bacteroidota bacterium]
MRLIILPLALLILMPLVGYTQPMDPPGPTPIDGGISLLLASGAALGVAKYRQHKKTTDIN